ncbi:MAG: putative transport system permease protein, partial [Patescibacteria group bacterium]|nr:putative transport system permease protein [Patescibacteria group bacterium]
TIRGEDFIVRGVFEEFAPVTLGQGIDLNRAIFVPDLSLKNVAGEAAPVVRVLVRPDNPDNAKELATNISNAVEEAHGGQNDITVLRQDENLAVNSNVLNLLTGFVAAIAAISLLVGGIGIMNIMLVSVSERTREIGIRKAVGATNRQIRNQFMAEAITLSFIGGLLGIIISFAINFIIRVTSNLTPVITWPVVVIATGVAISVGVLFGTVPAIKAARKDPIESLRVGS